MITEFSENEHLSGLESLIMQQNNSGADCKFRVLINLPGDLMREKVDDLLELCEVEHAFTQNKSDFKSQGVDLLLGTLLKERFEY